MGASVTQFPTPWRGLERASTEPADRGPLPISLLVLQLLGSAGEALATGNPTPEQVRTFGRMIRDIAKEEIAVITGGAP